MAQQVEASRTFCLRAWRVAVQGQSVFAALGPVLQQALPTHAEHRGDLGVVEECAVVDDPLFVAGVAKAALFPQRLEMDLARFERRERLVEAIDPVVLIGVFRLQPGAIDLAGASFPAA